MHNIFKPYTFLIFSIVILSFQSCKTESPKEVERKKFILSDSLARVLRFDTTSSGPVTDVMTLTGTVDFNEDNVVNIYPMVSGNIQDVKVALGDFVSVGQTLAVVKSAEMAAFSNDYTNANSNLNIARKNLEKTKDMYKSGLASMTDSLSTEVALQQAKSELSKVQRILKINGGSTQGDYIITAPISGFIVQKNITNNTAIRTDNNRNIFTISDLRKVWIQANVYESNINKIRQGQEVDVTTLSYPGRIFKGKIDKILNILDPANKVMKVWVVLDNPDYALKPQMFVSVTVTNKTDQQALCIPSSALIFDHSEYYVLVYKSNSDIRIAPVQVQSIYKDKTFISSGINAGDRLVSSQALFIYDQLNN